MRRTERQGRRRGWAVLLACIGALLLAGPLAAQAQERAERDVVQSINTIRSTLTITGIEYAVGASSRLYDAAERPIGLSELRAANGSVENGDMVEYTASDPSAPGALPEIDRLKVVEGVFE